MSAMSSGQCWTCISTHWGCSMAAFQRSTFVPGAVRNRDDLGMIIAPGKGRPMWNMPKPYKFVRHFKSAGAKAKFKRGEITELAAKKTVPVYRGLDIRGFRTLRNDQRQVMKRRALKRSRWARFTQAVKESMA